MAALLVAMTVMAVLMTVAMPVWKQMGQREKETELVFRGQQYARAIGLFQRKTGPGVLPPNLDVLVDQKFLRRKYKDPVTGEDFLLIPGAVAAGAQAQLQAAASQLQTLGRGSQTAGQSAASAGYVAQGGPFGSNVPGGITGVVSKSTDTSIRILNGRTHYNEWEFRFIAPPLPPPPQQGGADGGRGNPLRGGPGTPDISRGGRATFGTPPAPGTPRGRTFQLGPDGKIIEVQPDPSGRGPAAGRGVSVPPPGSVGRGATPPGR